VWRPLAQLFVPLVLPLITATYLLTAPHGWLVAFSAYGLIITAIGIDMIAGPERTQPTRALPDSAHDLVLYAAFGLQMSNLALLMPHVLRGGFFSLDTHAAIFLVGANSAYSAIVVGHELIHRPQKHFRSMGRILMASVLYEHFFTEHIRGHHRRIGTEDDPATARYGETIGQFFRRTVPGQFNSAWRLETKRLGDADMPLTDRRLLRSRVVQGLALGWGTAAAIAMLLGPVPLFAFVLQAALAVLLLESVNYVEHWGLRRRAKRVSTVDSWDTESWFTYYTLVGLSRHADHHAHAARPYQALRHFDESPKMPYGYWGTVIMALFRNHSYRATVDAELKARSLGPYAAAA